MPKRRPGCSSCGSTETIDAVDNFGKPYKGCPNCVIALPNIQHCAALKGSTTKMIDDLKWASDVSQTYHFEVKDEEKEILRIEPGPRIFVEGEETSDVERIGAAFRKWAASVAPPPKRHEASCIHGDCWCVPGSDGT